MSTYREKYSDSKVYGLPLEEVLPKRSVPSRSKTHLGNDMLHKNKSVMVESGVVARSRVMDQCIIDRYLMRGELNLPQHRAGELILGQAAMAKSWATGVNLSGTRVSGGKKDHTPFGVFPLGRTLVMIKKRYGWFHMYLVTEVVLHDWDVSKDEFKMECLREGLDWVADRRMNGKPDPLGILKRRKSGA